MKFFKISFGKREKIDEFKIPQNIRIVKKTYGDGTVKFHIEELLPKEFGSKELVWQKFLFYVMMDYGLYCGLGVMDYTESHIEAIEQIKKEIDRRNSREIINSEILV